MNVDQRKSARKTLRIKASFSIGDAEPMAANTMDIGKFGMSLTNIRQPVAMGQHARIAFGILFAGKFHALDIAASVAYCIASDGGEGYQVGVQFLNLDSDSAIVIAQYIAH